MKKRSSPQRLFPCGECESGHVFPALIDKTVRVQGRRVLVRDVRVLKCDACGEWSISAEERKRARLVATEKLSERFKQAA